MDMDIELKDAKKPAKTVPRDGAATVKIMIPKTERDVRDVFVAVNFVPYLIKRGVPVDVPLGVVEALKDAVQTTYVKEVDEKTGRESLRPQETLSVPFQYL